MRRWLVWSEDVRAFHFRLAPALRWRETQLRLAQESVSRVTAQIAALQADLLAAHAELRSASAQLVLSGSTAFGSWDAYADRCRRRIRSREEQLRAARKDLAEQTRNMTDAHRKLQILENLRNDERFAWRRQLEAETEALAADAFLAGLTRKTRVARAKAADAGSASDEYRCRI